MTRRPGPRGGPPADERDADAGRADAPTDRRRGASRREVLHASAAAVTLGAAGAFGAFGALGALPGCKNRRAEPDRKSRAEATPNEPADARAALAAIVLAVGPWPAHQPGVAEHFLDRYLTDDRVRGFEDAAPVLAAVARRLPADARALEDVALAELSPPEREQLLRVVHDVYGIQEVRFFLAGQPPPGACMGDLAAFLRAP